MLSTLTSGPLVIQRQVKVPHNLGYGDKYPIIMFMMGFGIVFLFVHPGIINEGMDPEFIVTIHILLLSMIVLLYLFVVIFCWLCVYLYNCWHNN